MTKKRKPPRWTIPFLRALERTGQARAAAADAGIDHSTAYARRRAHADFAAAWLEALAAHEAEKQRAEQEELEEFLARQPTPAPPHQGEGKAVAHPHPPRPLDEPPSPATGRGADEELVAQNGRLKRAGHGRWSRRKEKIFFDELAATANARRAAEAVGLTKNAVLQRRLRHPLFAAKWDAVVATAKAAINLYLVEASNRTFDPGSVATGADMEAVAPKVTIAEAIRISEQGARAAREAPNPFEEQAQTMSGAEVDALRSAVFKKLLRLKDRDEQEQLSQGWTRDEESGVLVPPGWTRSGAACEGPDDASPEGHG